MARVKANKVGFNSYMISVLTNNSGWHKLTVLERSKTVELLSRSDGMSVSDIRIFCKIYRKSLLKRIK